MIPFIILLLAMPALAADNRDFRLPLTGIVAPSKGGRLTVHQAPPEVGAFSYKRAERICALGAGSKFTASKDVHIITGELWFKIKADKPVNHDCKKVPVSGWILARSQSGILSVDVIEERPEIQQFALREYLQQQQALIGEVGNLGAFVAQGSTATASPAEEQAATRPDETDDADETETPAEEESMATVDETETSEMPQGESPSPFGDFLLVFLGSVLGTLVIAIERARSIHIAEWFSPLLVFEGVVLAIVNFIVAHTFVDELFSVGEVSTVFLILRAIYSAPAGFLLWGFVLSILLLKFISFDKGDSRKPTESQA